MRESGQVVETLMPAQNRQDTARAGDTGGGSAKASAPDRATLELLRDQLLTDSLRHAARLAQAGVKGDAILAAILKECEAPEAVNGEVLPGAKGHAAGCKCKMCQAVARKVLHSRALKEQAKATDAAKRNGSARLKRVSVKEWNKGERMREIQKRMTDPTSPTFADATASAKSLNPELSDSQAYNQGKAAIQDARTRILSAHSKAGISDDLLAQRLHHLLFAKKTEFFAHQGEVVEEREVDALNIQLGALELGHKLRGEMPKEEPDVQASLIIQIGGEQLPIESWDVLADVEAKRRIAERQAKVIEASVVESDTPAASPTTTQS